MTETQLRHVLVRELTRRGWKVTALAPAFGLDTATVRRIIAGPCPLRGRPFNESDARRLRDQVAVKFDGFKVDTVIGPGGEWLDLVVDGKAYRRLER